MNSTYTKQISKLIDSVAQDITNSQSRVMLIKHYNSLNLKQEVVDEVFADKKGMRYTYHEFDSSVMAKPYEPFMSFIKTVFYEEYDMTIDQFLEECGVYELHKSVIKFYFETGICKRDDEVLVSEYPYECQRMQENIANMLQYISSKENVIFVFDRLNDANESTIRILKGMIGNEKYKNISIIATYNEMNSIPDYILNLWKEYMDYLIRTDSIVEWSISENEIITDFRENFTFSVEKISQYMEDLRNMYHMMTIRQAEYYFNLIYKKIEFEKLDIPGKDVFEFLELYAEIALMLDNNSEAMIYAEGMKNIDDEEIPDKKYRYKYLMSQIYMFSGHNEDAQKAASECYRIAKEQGNEFAMFRADLAHFVAGYSGWKIKAFLDQYSEPSDSLLEDAEKYGYYNQLAHICVLAFDNKGEKFREIDKLEENLKYFYKGINIARGIERKIENNRVI